MRFEIKKSENKQFYFVMIADNGEPVLTSETYKRKKDCMSTIFLIRASAAESPIHDRTGEGSSGQRPQPNGANVAQ